MIIAYVSSMFNISNIDVYVLCDLQKNIEGMKEEFFNCTAEIY